MRHQTITKNERYEPYHSGTGVQLHEMISMSIIEINESNYQTYTKLDIVAFSFAYEGAMGDSGSICIIDKAGQIYYAKYCWSDDCIDRDHIKDIIPIFDELEFHMFGIETKNENWASVDLGFGNSLLITKDISEEFNQKVKEANFQRVGQLFQHWPGFVLGMLGANDTDLTMSRIWDIKKD